MATILEQVVLLNNDPPASRLCFVCGLHLKEVEELKIVETKTICTHAPLPNKLSDLVGNEFCILVSKFDEICNGCLLIVNKVDKLEYNLECEKNKILQLLEAKYNIALTETFEKTEDLVLDEEERDESQDDEEKKEEINADPSEEVKPPQPLNSDVELCLQLPMDCQSSTSSVKDQQTTLDLEIDDKQSETSLHRITVSASLDNVNFYDLGTSKEYKDVSDKNILCEYCCSSFSHLEELNHHVDKCHKADESIDSIFDGEPKVFIDDSIKEQDDDVSSTIFKCGVCDFTDSDIDVVLKHLQTSHKDICEVLGDSLEKTSELLVHYVPGNKADGLFICKICDMPFPNKTILAKHFLVHNKSEGPIICQICGKVCHDNLHAMYHRKNDHSISQDLSCGLCNTPMVSNVELKHHILMMHRGKKEYKCKECNKTFSRQLQYENHRTYAHGNSQCRVCGKHIENLVKLRQHEHRHARAETKKFECEVCNKVFKTQGGLKVHSVSHTGKYKFFCEFCGRGFMSSVILEEHKGVHTKEERYVCDICGRKFVLYSTFHLHKQWHKDPYPFPCKMCGRKFRYRSERSNHVRRDHTGETPYKCDHCFAAFIKLGYLKKHLTTHTKIHPHMCDLCDKGYYQKRALARHYAKVHNDHTLLQSFPKTCQYKVALRPDEYPSVEVD